MLCMVLFMLSNHMVVLETMTGSAYYVALHMHFENKAIQYSWDDNYKALLVVVWPKIFQIF